MEQANLCRRNCNECSFQSTMEAKQICASFNAIQILAFIENKVIELGNAINKPIEVPTVQPIAFNENVVAICNDMSTESIDMTTISDDIINVISMPTAEIVIDKEATTIDSI